MIAMGLDGRSWPWRAIMTSAQSSAAAAWALRNRLSNEEAIEFVLRLANGDYGDLTEPGRLDNMLFQLERWLTIAPGSVFGSQENRTPAQFEVVFVRQIREHVTAYVDKGEFEANTSPTRVRVVRLADGLLGRTRVMSR